MTRCSLVVRWTISVPRNRPEFGRGWIRDTSSNLKHLPTKLHAVPIRKTASCQRCEGLSFRTNGIGNRSTSKTGNAHITILRRVRELLLPWKRSKFYICVCPGAWCVHVALLMQHDTRMRHIVTSFVTPLAAPNFSTLSHKRHNFLKILLNLRCVLIFSTAFV